MLHFLFLSNLISSKGVFILLDACSLLRQNNREFQCHFVGAETEILDTVRMKQEISDRHLNDYAIYHGSTYGLAKEAFFKNADVFVFPTFYDCFPIVLLEAMQHALPCISTNEGAIPDIIEDGVTGLIIPRKDVLTLFRAMERLILNPKLCDQYGQAGKERYRKFFIREIFERNLSEILNKIISV